MLRAGRVLADGRVEGIDGCVDGRVDGRVDGCCAGRVVGRPGRFSGGLTTIGRSSSYQYPGLP
jgi:hypothetical protein